MTALRADSYLRYHNTDDGEPYWVLTLADVLDIITNELTHQRRVRALNKTTGEILEGGYLQIVLGYALRWVQEGNEFRFEVIE